MTLAPFKQSLSRRSLNARLLRRMAIEAKSTWTGQWGRRSRFSTWLERNLTKPLLKSGLEAVGLYSQGLGNALRPEVRRIRLHYPSLPAALDGFKILQLADLHIDGVDGLTEVVTGMLGNL